MQENIYHRRLEALRRLMRARGIDAYLVLTDDYHASEYVGDYFKSRAKSLAILCGGYIMEKNKAE